MKIVFEEFAGEHWVDQADILESALRKEIHNGLALQYRQTFEKKRKTKLAKLKEKFHREFDIEQLDYQLEEYTREIKNINSFSQKHVNFNLINYIKDNLSKLKTSYPLTTSVIEHLSECGDNHSYASRIQAILNKVVFDSTIQSNKSNAGNAGEDFVETMFVGIGLREGEHFKRQHKSPIYSDTDFVFPHVNDGTDAGIQIFVAVQFSSNDRFRMVKGELKSGANAYAITGNGLSASSKDLDDVGTNILAGMDKDNHHLVCFGPEKERKIVALKNQLSKRKKDGSPYKKARDWEVKLRIFEERTLSFSEFAKQLKDRYL